MKTYIIHVRTAHERLKHMQSQLLNKDLDTQFILDGDREDISLDRAAKYFSPALIPATNVTSCAFKHILVYEHIVKNKIECALILEDDIFLSSNFSAGLAQVLVEIKAKQYEFFIASLEDSTLEHVKRSEYKPNTLLYPKMRGRCTGAYLIDYNAAKVLLEEIELNKCHRPIDLFHNHCAKKGLFKFFWMKDAIATQGSLNGQIKSIISDKPTGIARTISFEFQRFYKTLLYNLR